MMVTSTSAVAPGATNDAGSVMDDQPTRRFRRGRVADTREGRPMTQGAVQRTAGGVDAGVIASEIGPPGWLRFLALAAAAGVLTFGSAGLVLAVNGWYRPALAFPLGAVGWVVVLVLARPVLR